MAAGEGGELSGKFSGGVIIFCCGGIFCGFLAKLFLSSTESVPSKELVVVVRPKKIIYRKDRGIRNS